MSHYFGFLAFPFLLPSTSAGALDDDDGPASIAEVSPLSRTEAVMQQRRRGGSTPPPLSSDDSSWGDESVADQGGDSPTGFPIVVQHSFNTGL